MKQEPKTLGFVFQEIDLQEAKLALQNRRSRYHELIQTVVKTLSEMPLTKAFAFGLPDHRKELSANAIHQLRKMVHQGAKTANLPWKVHYSSKRKLFICVPTSSGEQKPRKAFHIRRNADDPEKQAILRLWNEGATVKEIVDQLKAPLQRVRYLCYQENPRTPRGDGN